MQPNNNIYIGTPDPLLHTNPTSYNIESRIAEIENLKNLLSQKEQYLEQAKTQVVQAQPKSRTPVWDEIDSIVQSLSDEEYEFVINNQEFIDSSKAVAELVQSAYMQMMRPIVEGSQNGKDALDAQLTLVKRLKKSAAAQVSKKMSEFQEYTEKYSSMSYDDYLKMKRENNNRQ